jgi:arsenate reductase (glutaredoxin)
MAVKVYGYKNCSTCKKALGFLNKKKKTFEDVDITTTPPTKKELEAMFARVGDIKKLFNTSGQVYREMGLGEKLAGMSAAEALKLLASNGRLVKRPFLVVDGKPVAVGFKEEDWKNIF